MVSKIDTHLLLPRWIQSSAANASHDDSPVGESRLADDAFSGSAPAMPSLRHPTGVRAHLAGAPQPVVDQHSGVALAPDGVPQ